MCAPTFLVRSLNAAQDTGLAPPDLGSGRILVVVELAGGCDGLNTVVPFNSDVYYQRRPRLAIPAAQVLPLDHAVGLHPSMLGLKQLFDEGKLAVVQGVGYPNPNRSHFGSRDIWHTAKPDEIGSEGWLAKYTAQSVDTYKVDTDRRYQSSSEYPATAFAQDLKEIAQIIAADLGVVVFHAGLGGFDTHVGQVSETSSVEGRHALLLDTLSAALLAFFEDLRKMGKDQDTLIVTFSEFGRRLSENGSLGTDHGTANQIFLLSSSLAPGLYGTHPGLADGELDAVGDLVFTLDFRSVYTTVLSNWLGVDPEPVLGESFPDLGFLRFTS
jgi:uncharacterized protein (DUF1501 family)